MKFDPLALLKKFGLPILEKEAAGRVLRPRMEAAIPHIVDVMTKSGKTPDKVDPRICVHKALYHLWDALVPGEIADLLRDHQDAAVWAAVQEVGAPADLSGLVRATMEAALSHLAGGK